MKERTTRVLALVTMLLGLLVVLTPRFIFPICESAHLSLWESHDAVMRCYWFGKAEFLIGGLVVLAGLLAFVRPTRETRSAAGIMLAGLGLVAILLSLDTVIGSTCGHSGSICQLGAKPAVRAAGGVAVIIGLLFALSARSGDERG